MAQARRFDDDRGRNQLNQGGLADGVHIEIVENGVSMIWLLDRSEDYLASIKPEYRGERILIRVVECAPQQWEATNATSGAALGVFPTRKKAFQYGRAHLFVGVDRSSATSNLTAIVVLGVGAALSVAALAALAAL